MALAPVCHRPVGRQIFLFWYCRTGHVRNDKPGMAAMRLYGDFLRYVAKPKLTIVVTGTNGKTTISALIAGVLRKEGKSVSFNDWGANHHAGVARCLLDAVDLFNRPTKDAVVVELDELISPLDLPALQPDYVVISNLARDSMLRNAHPAYIAGRLKEALAGSAHSVVIVNGDDPLSCFWGRVTGGWCLGWRISTQTLCLPGRTTFRFARPAVGSRCTGTGITARWGSSTARNAAYMPPGGTTWCRKLTERATA